MSLVSALDPFNSLRHKNVPNVFMHGSYLVFFCLLQPDNIRLRIIGRLKCLSVLNGAIVTETESSGALRVAAGSRISQVSLLTFSRTDHSRPRSLSLLSTAQVLYSKSRNKPEKISEHDANWYSKVKL